MIKLQEREVMWEEKGVKYVLHFRSQKTSDESLIEDPIEYLFLFLSRF